MTEKHRLAISRGLRKLRKRRRLSAAMKASWVRRRNEANASTNHTAINEERKRNHAAIDLVLENALHKATITSLVRTIDELRQPYNNSKRHDLYLMATNKLNDLEDRGLIRWE